MDENQKQQLQEELTEAMISGNTEKQREVETRINSFLENVPPVQEEAVVVPEAVEAAPKVEEVQEGTEAEGSKEAAPLVEKEDNTPPEKTESEQNWLDSIENPAIRKKAEELLEKEKRLEHRIKADDGRVAAYQRRYHELQQKAVRQEEELQNLRANKPQATPAAKKETPKINDDLKAILETDEQLGRALIAEREEREQELEQMRQRLAQFEQSLAPLHQSREDMEVRTELERLQSEWSNAVDVLRSNEWKEWVDLQPPGVRQLANSSKAEDVSSAFHLFGMWVYQNDPSVYATNNATVATPIADERTAKIQSERERKLNAQPVGSSAIKPPVKTEPTLAEIYNSPKLLEEYQTRIMQEEMKKLGIG